MTRRSALYRQGLPALELGGVTALLVDDGLATGVTARAAARSARLQGAASVILAVPVCAAQTTHALRAEVDHLIALSTRETSRRSGCGTIRLSRQPTSR
ncbi:MAG: hypothetical protein WKH64_07145 [Chloroflexia bacterium]